MIKFVLRRNLIYPLQLIIWHLLRKFEMSLITSVFNFGDSLTYTPLMFLGEFFAGLIIHSYQSKSLKKKKKKRKLILLNQIYFYIMRLFFLILIASLKSGY